MPEMKTMLHGIKGRLGIVERKISKFINIAIETNKMKQKEGCVGGSIGLKSDS